jgi:glycosyltransferase involved in cell wall biosynthesis
MVVPMLPLTLAIITRDEASRISQAIASVGAVAEILVLDSGSTDETVAIARGLGARVEQVDWPGYGAQKNRALEMAQQDWVLSIDADEVLSEDLRRALQALFKGDIEHSAYAVLRRNHWQGKPVRGGAYGPCWKNRLVRKSQGRWVGGILHETLSVDSPVGQLSGFLEHTPYRDEEEFRATAADYAALFAKKNLMAGRRARWFDAAVRPILHFVKAYLLKAGFRDGKTGWKLAVLESRAVALKWSSLRSAQSKQDNLKRKE